MNESSAVEVLIDKYIREKSLIEGATLPPDNELAQELKCDAKAISEALINAEEKGKVKREENGQIVVLSLPTVSDSDIFSFTKSAQDHGEPLITQIMETALRLPLKNINDPITTMMENKAHKSLDLPEGTPFIVISRLRLLHNEPRVLHRAYLNPKPFPKNFLEGHNFETESLIHIYNQYGCKLSSRDTTLTARFTNPYEASIFNAYLRPVLQAEQKLFATNPENGERFVLEFLHAAYLDWKYEIKNRPAG